MTDSRTLDAEQARRPTKTIDHSIANDVADDEPDTVGRHQASLGAGLGAGFGGTVGALTAAIAGAITSIALPFCGYSVDGSLAAAALGAGAGMANGGLVGALIGWSVPVEEPAVKRIDCSSHFEYGGQRHADRATPSLHVPAAHGG